ncbi:disease resistance family protein / LRR family protein [Euphorbia peplus]|nr:disease resistance family protein / LRR family protein [Euphorbia peplus]
MSIFIRLVLFTLAIILTMRLCEGLCVETEKQALLRFKQELEDPKNKLLSWNTSAESDCCQWEGVVCDNITSNVKELNLGGSGLRGNVTASLLDLKHLTHLDLSLNAFGGIPIPEFIGSMVNLTYLEISEAGFQGLIPSDLGNLSRLSYLGVRGPCYALDRLLFVENLGWLSNLSSLVHLDLSCVDLSADSEWLLRINTLPFLLELYVSDCNLDLLPPLPKANFSSLSVLDMAFNNFGTPIPEWITSLSSLISLDLHFNAFEGMIPCAISNLTSLESLDFSFNNLVSPLPSCLFSLNGLHSIKLGANLFKGPIPPEFQNMTGLRVLDLSQIDLGDSVIPDWIYGLSNLESLSLKQARLRGEISSAIQNMTSLVEINLSSNELEGTIPQTIGSLCNLKAIKLGYNKLSGEISEALESLTGCLSDSLQILKLDANKYSGHLTEKLGMLRNLRVISIWANSISGPIPESIGGLLSLTTIDLRDNQMNGTLPAGIGNLSNLQILYVSRNKLEGFITDLHLAKLHKLIGLRASHSHFVFRTSPGWVPPFRLNDLQIRNWDLGPNFPAWLQSQDYFGYLDLSNTGISDTIPDWFWNLTSFVYYLNISHNQIHGQLPSTMTFLSGDPIIYLRNNRFDGPLPRISERVTELDLSRNSFSGSLSNFMCNTTSSSNSLKNVHLEENNLSGDIPDCWMYWKSLRIINMGSNNLTGKIPSSIGHLTRLLSLHLRNNSVTGVIPAALKNCTELFILELGINHLVGSIPAWFGSSLRNLKVLTLPGNNLDGEIPPEFCELTSLQLLDLGNNRFSGPIPSCFDNLKAMATVQNPSFQITYLSSYNEILDDAFAVTKGREVKYDTLLTMVTSMDISNNNLSGDIPDEVTALSGLRFLNFSGNHLTGEIPKNIGRMKKLESVDLSKNRLSGNIPPSMSGMNFLSYLNISYNNLSGQIPSSTQLQSLDASTYIGNNLCGPPLTKDCSVDQSSANDDNEEEEESDNTVIEDYFLSSVLGFVVGFWGILGPILFVSKWRIVYFSVLDKTTDSIHGMFSK